MGDLFSRVRQQPMHAALIATSVLLAITGIAVGAFVVVRLRGVDPHLPTLDQALHELDGGRYAQAKDLAHEFLADKKLEFDERGGALFVLGAVAAHEAEQAWSADQKRRLYAVAARYLDEARDCGFPEEREAQGLCLLAECEFRAGRYAQSIPLLLEARRVVPERRTEMTGMLASACWLDSKTRLPEALKYNQQYLADGSLTAAAQHKALLERSQIEFLLGRFEASAKSLDEIPATENAADGVAVMRARLLIQQGDEVRRSRAPEDGEAPEATAYYEDAVKLLRPVQSRAEISSQALRDAQFLLGQCLLKLGDLRGAEAQFSRTRRLNLGTMEAIAAALEEADLLRQAGRYDTALFQYQQILQDVGPPEDYRNPWMSLDYLRGRLELALEGFREQERFEAALKFADSLPPVFELSRSVELRGEIEQAWAKSLAQEAARATTTEAGRMAAEARAKHREAGVTFARLAELRKAEREYPDDVWRSAENFSAGQDYAHALRMVKTYLAEEPRQRRSAGLIALGECYLALNKLDQAIPPLLECVESFRKHPDSYRARLVASQAYLEKNQLPEAKALLVDNLEHESLAPGSIEWRDSLFALGKLLHREATDLETQSRKQGVDSPYSDIVKTGLKDLERSYAIFQEAVDRLGEAVQRYPDAPQTIEARYLIAESHRQSAKWPRKLRASIAIETTRATLHRQAQEQLLAAAAEYEPLLAQLNERQEQGGLTEFEGVVMRNCYFSRADVLFDLERFDDAIAAYSSATNRYHDRPEALEAFVQIASCYRRMNRPAEARGTLEQAKVVLRRIPAEAAFTQTTRYDRGEWSQLLNWLSSL